MDAVGETCPSWGGAGGGPFGRAGSAWDVDDYVCVRCDGAGVVAAASGATAAGPARPGVAKARGEAVEPKSKAGAG
jgi:hypothetical protein